jgi:hypothetical protein
MDKFEEYKQRTNYYLMSEEEKRAVARKAYEDLKAFKKNHSEDLTEAYYDVRKKSILGELCFRQMIDETGFRLDR